MRIGIDAHAIGSRLGGNETYIAGLLEGLGRIEPSHEFIAYFASEKAAEPWRGRFDNLTVRVLKSPSAFPRLLMEFPARAVVDRLDLLHVQYVAPPVSLVPVVATIHDISYEFFPQFFSRKEILQFRTAIRWTARRARRVITISENSKRDIIDIYEIPPDRVDVTYLGVDLTRFRPPLAGAGIETVLSRYGIEKPYVLAIGNLQPRKNLPRLIDAFVDLKRRRPELSHRLILAGKPAFRHSEVFSRVRKYGLDEEVIFTGYLPDDDLPVLYQGADVFAYPSLYEGFGLPVAEAMACGTPVVTSNRSAMPEVAGDAAILVDPEDTAEIAEGLLKILADPGLAATMSRRGEQQAKRFTWDSTARLTLTAFESAAMK